MPAPDIVATFIYLRSLTSVAVIGAEAGGPGDAQNLHKPTRAFLVFSAATMASPTSMFGHTMLVLTAAEAPELLSTAVEYTATIDTTGVSSMIWNGLTGGFTGFFQERPLWEKIKDYQELEMRDIWIYELNLDRAEVTRLCQAIELTHGKTFPYYFLWGNCAARLLPLLDVARPGLALTSQTGVIVAPADMLRIVERSRMIRRMVYRPSLATKIRQAMTTVSPDAQAMVTALAHPDTDIPHLKLPRDPGMAVSACDIGLDHAYPVDAPPHQGWYNERYDDKGREF